MRDDLLHADASVQWATAQFLSLQARIDAWEKRNFYVSVKELPPPATNDVVLALAKEPLPLSFNVEVGAYINAIRSALDILATALAYRYGIRRPEKAYFPITDTEHEFTRGRAGRFVDELPAAARTILQGHKPYRGGNDCLWMLHKLDVYRKHHRLLAVSVRPRKFGVWGWNLSATFTPVATGWMPVNDQETVGTAYTRRTIPEYGAHGLHNHRRARAWFSPAGNSRTQRLR